MNETAATSGGVAAPLEPGQELGVFGRLINVFIAPSKTFESIDRRVGWDWIVPILLVCAAIFAFQSVALPRIDADEAIDQQVRIVEKVSGKEMSAEDRAKVEEQARESFEAQKSPVRRLFVVPFVFLFFLVPPALYYAIAASFGKGKSFMRLVAGYAYTNVIQIVPLLLATAVAYPKEKISAMDVQFYRVLKSNVAAWLDFDTTHKAVLAFLSSFDVFDVWLFIVGTIAVSRLTRFSVKGAALVVGSVLGMYILLKVALGLVFQAFTLG